MRCKSAVFAQRGQKGRNWNISVLGAQASGVAAQNGQRAGSLHDTCCDCHCRQATLSSSSLLPTASYNMPATPTFTKIC